MQEDWTKDQIDQFIRDEIDSVPHLEALLLIWNHRPRQWSAEEMARELYVTPDVAGKILRELANHSLISVDSRSPASFFYDSGSSERDHFLAAVDRIYRSEIVRVSTMIHAKASPAVRDFARAFRFTKEREE